PARPVRGQGADRAGRLSQARRQGNWRASESGPGLRAAAACGNGVRRPGRALRVGQGLPGRPQRRGYQARQALLADLYWRGRHVKKDERRALALITVAVENAPEHERIWIEDIYQNIFCGTSQGTRKQADGIVATWKKIFTRPAAPPDRMALGGLEPQRKCGTGEVLDIRREAAPPKETPPAVVATPPAARPEPMQGSTGFGLRDIGKK